MYMPMRMRSSEDENWDVRREIWDVSFNFCS